MISPTGYCQILFPKPDSAPVLARGTSKVQHTRQGLSVNARQMNGTSAHGACASFPLQSCRQGPPALLARLWQCSPTNTHLGGPQGATISSTPWTCPQEPLLDSLR